jgi:small subunit ribosomal protein S7
MVTAFINAIMRGGKRSLAERIFYSALEKLKEKKEEDPIKVFKKALENVKPRLEVKSRRVGGSTYQIPIEVREPRSTSLGIRWLLTFARQRPEKTMPDRLANEFLDAFANRGGSIKKREDTHKMAEANKAFAHYKW